MKKHDILIKETKTKEIKKMARPSKNQVKSTGGNKDVQVKYADARMAYMNTKKELVVKESNI